MADARETKTLIFRCPAELEGWLPAPVPAAAGLPEWLKAMPSQVFSELVGAEDDTLKRCPPVIDVMTAGFLIPLICDVRVKAGEFSWDADIPAGGPVGFARSPIGLMRKTARTIVTSYGRDMAVASTLFYRDTLPGKVGRQMQTWVRFADGWRIVAAHVSIIDEPKGIA